MGDLFRARSGQSEYFGVRNVQMFLTDITNLPAIRDIRDEFVNTEQPPASTTVQVAALFHPGVLFEIDAIAYAPTDQIAQ
jgi:enamine deaminase RidA (YjgF/YER057c/UK114 family)